MNKPIDPAALEKAVALLKELKQAESQRVFCRMYPEETQGEFYARKLYPKHMEFFAAGAKYRERALMAANRVGKTFGGGGFELTAHTTGEYPDWWEGRRFEKPIDAWAAGKTNETTRDIIQKTLLGNVRGHGPGKTVDGTGVIPKANIGEITWRQGVSDLVDTVKVKHKTGGWSLLGLKSYVQGRGSFEGTAKHLVWFDEEMPLDVYGEAVIRTATTNGLIMVTFTPLEGMSKSVLQFMPREMRPGGE